MPVMAIINEPYHKRQFGMIIRLYRIRQQHSLRSLAERTNISHAYLRIIETGQATISQKTFDYLTQTLNINIRYDAEEAQAFFQSADEVFNNILYLDATASEKNSLKLESKAAYHEQSLWMIEFLIIKMGYYNFVMDMDFSHTTTLYRELFAIQDLFDEQELQAFLTFSGAYFYHMSDYDNAIDKFREATQVNANSHLSGLCEYLIARTHMFRHHFYKANRHLQRAYDLFKGFNNYVRVSYTRLLMEIMTLMTVNHDQPDSLFKDCITFTKTHDLKGVEAFFRFNFALYYYNYEAYDKALETLRNIRDDSVQRTYYEAMIHLKKNDKAYALKTIKRGKALLLKPEKITLLYQYGFDMIEAYYNANDHEYDKALSRVYTEALTLKSYMELKDAYHLYTKFLETKRRYKKAYLLTQEFTAFTLESLH